MPALCASLYFRVHPYRWLLYEYTVRWSGGLISADGYTFNGAIMTALKEMEPLET